MTKNKYAAENMRKKQINPTFADSLEVYKEMFIESGGALKDIFIYITLQIKLARNGFGHAGRNNFRLGISMLKKNELRDAKFRFILADKFYPNSPIVQYYLAYVAYLQSNFTKSLLYIQKALDLGGKHQKRIEKLLGKIEKSITLSSAE